MINRPEYIKQLISYKDKQIIKVITGIRRSGKSTLFQLYIDYLLQNGVNREQIITINLEEIENEHLKDYKALYDYIKINLIENQQNYVFIDEVQECKEFQRAVDSLFVKDNVDIYITGSNAHMFSGELSTLLSGRYITIEMYPLSFKEYVSAIKDNKSKQELFRDYLRNGAFPYILKFENNENQIREYLKGIYSSIFIKDILLRYKINNQQMIEDVIKFAFDNIGNVTSSKKVSDTMTSFGRKISQPTVESYFCYLVDSYLLYKVNRYDIKGKQYLKSMAKYYVADLGLRNLLLGYKNMDRGHILENVVYLELKRRGYQLYIGKVNDLEVDFVAIKGTDIYYIQVADTVSDVKTLERELKPLTEIKDYNTRILITNDYDVNQSYDGIKHFNVIDFLLGENF